MPKREDIKSILVIGSGPIVIGQACEFDYSGAQACKVLREEGYRVILVNSNPATIMTDPELADATYVEPITPAFVEKVIAKERPDACLPTLGGQTGLNTAVELAKSGVLERYGVELIGCDVDVIERGEDRKLFNECMADLGIEVSRAGYAYYVEDALAIAEELGYPVAMWTSSCASSPRAWSSRRPARCWWRSPSRAGRNTRWRSCATRPATASSSAPSRIWTPWACTPATPSPWPRPRP